MGTICGTPEYMSPEQVTGIGHGLEADLWSLGVLLHEILVGQPPFGGSSKRETELYQEISSFKGDLSFDDSFDNDARDLIKGLLNPHPSHRLGCKHGIEDVMDHRFLSKYKHDLAVFDKRSIESPFKD